MNTTTTTTIDRAAATEEIALLPMSAAVESPAARQVLRHTLSGLGYPYLVLRLGIADQDRPVVPRTPRLPVATNVEVLP